MIGGRVRIRIRQGLEVNFHVPIAGIYWTGSWATSEFGLNMKSAEKISARRLESKNFLSYIPDLNLSLLILHRNRVTVIRFASSILFRIATHNLWHHFTASLVSLLI